MSIFAFEGQEDTITPQLVINLDQLDANTDHAIRIAGRAERLWPHVKTHKSGAVTEIMLKKGITKFKCATVAEAEMVAERGADKALIAYPAVGPALKRAIALQKAFPRTEIITLFDNFTQLYRMDEMSEEAGAISSVMLDVDTGFHRTGIPFQELVSFYKKASCLRNISIMGLHCYDGERHERDCNERHNETERTYKAVKAVVSSLKADGIEVPYIIMGGTPSFPCYAEHEEIYLSPGTCFLNDYGYTASFPDLDFPPAAAVLTRVVSKTLQGQFTLDLGCKGIASDPQGVRGQLVGFPDAYPVFQSEEHWVWRMREGYEDRSPDIGDSLFVIPTHICPTSALYPYAVAVSKGKRIAEWEVTARNRRITY